MISVIIPLYNKEHFIAKTIESVLAQTYEDFELIIINDGSTDHSADIVSSFKDARIKYVEKENRGVSSARNFGLRMAKGDFIAFLDADDTWYSNFLEQMMMLYDKYPNYYFFCCAQKDRLIPTLPDGISIIDDHCKYFYIYCTGSILLKKKVFDQVGTFREGIQHGEDLDMWLRIACKYKTVYINKELISYPHVTEGNLSRTLNASKSFPYWEWYNYSYKPKSSLYRYATNCIIRTSRELIEQGRYSEAISCLRKCKGFTSIRPRLKLLIRIILKK